MRREIGMWGHFSRAMQVRCAQIPVIAQVVAMKHGDIEATRSGMPDL